MAECVCGAWLTSDHTMCPQCGLPAVRSQEPPPQLGTIRPAPPLRQRVTPSTAAPPRSKAWWAIDEFARRCAPEGIMLSLLERLDEPGPRRWECTIFALRRVHEQVRVLVLCTGTGATHQAAFAAARRQLVTQPFSRAFRPLPRRRLGTPSP